MMGLDHGNIILMEHINLNTSLPEQSMLFFLQGLGCSQDPRMGVSPKQKEQEGREEGQEKKVYFHDTAWFNAGLVQFHMPLTTRGSGGPLDNKLHGTVGLLVPSLNELYCRLKALQDYPEMKATKFEFFQNKPDEIEAYTPSGVRILVREAPSSVRDTRCYHPGPISWSLHVPYFEFLCPLGSSRGIARFYEHYLGAAVCVKTNCDEDNEVNIAIITTSPTQQLRFREDPAFLSTIEGDSLPYQDAERGLHICIYLHDHAGPFRLMSQDNLLWGNPRFHDLDSTMGYTQFRFKDIVDMETKQGEDRHVLLELEHEVRSITHATSPFGGPRTDPYILIDRAHLVPQLVKEVTDEYERDFDSVRRARQQAPRGFVPAPPPVESPAMCSEVKAITIKCHASMTKEMLPVAVIFEELGLPYSLDTLDESFPASEIELFDPNLEEKALLSVSDGLCTALAALAQQYASGKRLFGSSLQETVKCLKILSQQVAARSVGTDSFLKYLETALGSSEFLVGKTFTIADISLASTLISLKCASYNESITVWRSNVTNRPGFRNALKRVNGAERPRNLHDTN